VFSQLDEEFRYLQRKKKVVKEFSEVRLKVSCPEAFRRIVVNILVSEHIVLVKPDQVSRRSPASYFTHVQSLSGRFFWHKCREYSAAAGRLWAVLVKK
jgi:hypothetical protein